LTGVRSLLIIMIAVASRIRARGKG
jgi:hypothetical protein